MGFQALTDEELELLSEIEDEQLPVEQMIIRKMTSACIETTTQFFDAYGKEAMIFEVMAPSDLPLEMGGKIQLMGMEELTFVKFVPSSKADIVCLFKSPEAASLVCIRYEWLEDVFGNRGRMMSDWIKRSSNLLRRRNEVITESKAQEPNRIYSDSSYGAW